MIEDVTPQIDAGGHAIRRVPGEEVVVNAAIFADGHDIVAAQVLFRHESESRLALRPHASPGERLGKAHSCRQAGDMEIHASGMD